MNNIFDPKISAEVIQRINTLTPESKALWGKMNVSQMLAHCNVTYEMVYDNIHPKPNAFMKMILKLMVKNTVVTEKPYKKNNPTAPAFMVKSDKNFEAEKARLIQYIQKTQELGAVYFEGKESHSFGSLTSGEWNCMFYKHLDHHLSQFGA